MKETHLELFADNNTRFVWKPELIIDQRKRYKKYYFAWLWFYGSIERGTQWQ